MSIHHEPRLLLAGKAIRSASAASASRRTRFHCFPSLGKTRTRLARGHARGTSYPTCREPPAEQPEVVLPNATWGHQVGDLAIPAPTVNTVCATQVADPAMAIARLCYMLGDSRESETTQRPTSQVGQSKCLGGDCRLVNPSDAQALCPGRPKPAAGSGSDGSFDGVLVGPWCNCQGAFCVKVAI